MGSELHVFPPAPDVQRWEVWIDEKGEERTGTRIGTGPSRADALLDASTEMDCLTTTLRFLEDQHRDAIEEVHRRACLYLANEMSREALAEACAAVGMPETDAKGGSDAARN